ncbi:TetR/AcrR family transcriptional regulator [Actinophytocola sp.]|uniref:TetR/AcrR family transcriptional regulator n=1 Tax=Actinophytocola sp. TaxID=1872138 RepID=UPI002ED035AF
MGNREDLLAGAMRCLYEKGYARTTARDIATAAGVSLAAIGYHYGTKDELLNAALYRALDEWSEDLREALATRQDATPAERFEETWTQVIRSFAANRRLWAVQFELLAHLDQKPEMKSAFAEANRQARQGLADLFGVPGEAAGAVFQALIGGLAAQWLVDPDSPPSGHDLREAIRAIAASVT